MPQLAEGIELIGEYEGSGFKEPPYLVRRADGQVLQLTRLLYLVAEEVDGKRDFGQIAERVTEKFGRTVSAENIELLVEKKLRPLGVLASADGTSPKNLEKANPVLALNLRAGLAPERVVRGITTVFYPLFFPAVVIAVLVAFVAFDVWFFFVHGVAQSVRDLTYQPVLFLMVLGFIVLSAAFHECGHATACRYGGAKPGVIGVGIYVVWPAFFSDVTDAYRLDKVGRVRTDLGGIYFNIIFSLLIAGAYFLTGFEPLLAVIVIQHLEIVHQLLPFLRLDGYYVVADITGVPDLFARIRPILRSLLPGKEPDDSVTALKPWVRVVVTVWVLMVIPILLYIVVVMAMSAPRLFATVYDSFFSYYDNVASAFSKGNAAEAVADSIQMVFLVLPLGGLTYTSGRVTKRLGVAAWKATEGNPTLRASFASIALVAIGVIAFLWWPHGQYRPIQPEERGTVQSGLSAIRDIPTGRPALTPEREAELHGAPTLREQQPGTGPSIEVPTEPTEVPTELKSEQQSSQRQESPLEATQPGTQKDQQSPVAAEEKR